MKLFLLLALFSTSVFSKQVEIEMQSISFEPKTITIAKGDTIVWKNVALTRHTASSTFFDTGAVEPKKKSKAITFNTRGTYVYNCKVHGQAMKGTVTVN